MASCITSLRKLACSCYESTTQMKCGFNFSKDDCKLVMSASSLWLQEIMETTRDYWRLLEITEDNWRLLEIECQLTLVAWWVAFQWIPWLLARLGQTVRHQSQSQLWTHLGTFPDASHPGMGSSQWCCDERGVEQGKRWEREGRKKEREEGLWTRRKGWKHHLFMVLDLCTPVRLILPVLSSQCN